MTQDAPSVGVVFAGGLALGAYEAGAYAALHAHGLRPDHVAGSSIGAVTAAILGGSAPDERVDRLRAFWDGVARPGLPAAWPSIPGAGLWRQALNEGAATQTFLAGAAGLFRPRLGTVDPVGMADVPALYDLAPLRDRLAALVDFDRLNAGPMRVTLCCTDAESGDRVVFDTGCGDRIGVEHVLASCALMPLSAPILVGGRALVDGGLSANTPLDLVLDAVPDRDVLCFVVELFATAGARPHTLAAALNRAVDLSFGNQTRRILDGQARAAAMRSTIGRLGALLPAAERQRPEVAALLAEGRSHTTTVAMLGYRGGLDEAGLFKTLDFSQRTLGDRWRAGEAAMGQAIALASAPRPAGFSVIEVAPEPDGQPAV